MCPVPPLLPPTHFSPRSRLCPCPPLDPSSSLCPFEVFLHHIPSSGSLCSSVLDLLATANPYDSTWTTWTPLGYSFPLVYRPLRGFLSGRRKLSVEVPPSMTRLCTSVSGLHPRAAGAGTLTFTRDPEVRLRARGLGLRRGRDDRLLPPCQDGGFVRGVLRTFVATPFETSDLPPSVLLRSDAEDPIFFPGYGKRLPPPPRPLDLVQESRTGNFPSHTMGTAAAGQGMSSDPRRPVTSRVDQRTREVLRVRSTTLAFVFGLNEKTFTRS